LMVLVEYTPALASTLTSAADHHSASTPQNQAANKATSSRAPSSLSERHVHKCPPHS
jgi:hypothetical protein